MQTSLFQIPIEMSKSDKIQKLGQKKEVIVPFERPSEIEDAWGLWKRYKKEEHRFRFKSPISEQAAINKLFRLSKGDPIHAKHIILQSLENGWAGLFALKKDYIQDFKVKSEKDEIRAYREAYGLTD